MDWEVCSSAGRVAQIVPATPLTVWLAGGGGVRRRGELAQLLPRDRPLMDLVGSVGEPQRPQMGVHHRQREVAGYAAAAMHLDRPVDDLQRDLRVPPP